jgi:23S rRNA maturation mini-RNase III
MAHKMSDREKVIEARIKRAASQFAALNAQLKGLEDTGLNSTATYLKVWNQRNRLQATINKMYQATY